MGVSVGTQFSTGNSTVAQLPIGSVLEVVGDGRIEVVDLPEPEATFDVGDEVTTKYGNSRIIRLTSRLEDLIAAAKGETDHVIYIADGTNVVRVAAREDVS